MINTKTTDVGLSPSALNEIQNAQYLQAQNELLNKYINARADQILTQNPKQDDQTGTTLRQHFKKGKKLLAENNLLKQQYAKMKNCTPVLIETTVYDEIILNVSSLILSVLTYAKPRSFLTSAKSIISNVEEGIFYCNEFKIHHLILPHGYIFHLGKNAGKELPFDCSQTQIDAFAVFVLMAGTCAYRTLMGKLISSVTSCPLWKASLGFGCGDVIMFSVMANTSLALDYLIECNNKTCCNR